MKRQTYERMTARIKASPFLCNAVIWTDRIIAKLCYVAYPLFLVSLLIRKEPEVLRALLVPCISFAAASLFRYWYNAPRPYQVYGIEPVISKDTEGKSFPSMHVFSICVITVTVFYFYPILGVFLGILALALSGTRILGGVHYPIDVAGGASFGFLSGIIGFYII
ncbi:MAG: phosphatase PAP2 family protein [Clostridiales bacterium]|nr:phosphatase PAP2 family protein [Clostridiales bacterium]